MNFEKIIREFNEFVVEAVPESVSYVIKKRSL